MARVNEEKGFFVENVREMESAGKNVRPNVRPSVRRQLPVTCLGRCDCSPSGVCAFMPRTWHYIGVLWRETPLIIPVKAVLSKLKYVSQA